VNSKCDPDGHAHEAATRRLAPRRGTSVLLLNRSISYQLRWGCDDVPVSGDNRGRTDRPLVPNQASSECLFYNGRSADELTKKPGSNSWDIKCF
jgi:hypothetical protein